MSLKELFDINSSCFGVHSPKIRNGHSNYRDDVNTEYPSGSEYAKLDFYKPVNPENVFLYTGFYSSLTVMIRLNNNSYKSLVLDFAYYLNWADLEKTLRFHYFNMDYFRIVSVLPSITDFENFTEAITLENTNGEKITGNHQSFRPNDYKLCRYYIIEYDQTKIMKI